MHELAEAQRRAWRRIPAAKGRLTRAQRDGSASQTAAAADHLRQAEDDAARIADAAIPEMLAANQRGLDNLGRLLDAAGQVMHPEREAGQ